LRTPRSECLTTASASPDAQLVRVIGTRELTANIVNATVGAGIFVLPAAAAMGLGAAAPVAYIACAALMTLIVLCFAAAGSRVSLTGGLYAYIEVAFGGFAGFAGGVFYWSTACFSVASVAAAFAGSLGVIWTPLGSGLLRALVLATLFGGLALVNVRGVKRGIRLVEAITAAKLAPLLLLIAAGAWSLNPAYLKFSMPPLSQVGQASILLIFAFEGIEVALMPVGEVRDPARTVPRSILGALVITTLLYLAIQAVAQGILGPQLSTYADAPLAEAAGRLLGRFGKALVLAGGTISMFGYVSGDMLGTPRALFAMGRDGALPGALARVHQRYRTPAVAIIIYAVIVAALSVSSSFNQLAVLANVSGLLLYGLCVAASYQLQRRNVRMAGTPFNLPGGIAIQAAALLGIVWLVLQATGHELLIEACVLVAASCYYLMRRRLGLAKSNRPQQST
jgi:APA family basic amino acid/polyamine antiporter